jgi:hypothetical protein
MILEAPMDVVARIGPAPEAQRCDLLLVTDQPWERACCAAGVGRTLLRALLDAGVTAQAASPYPLTGDAPAWLRAATAGWPTAQPDDVRLLNRHWAGPLMPLRLAASEEQDLPLRTLAGLARLVRDTGPKAIVALGPSAPLLLAAAGRGPLRLWVNDGQPATGLRGRVAERVQQLATRRQIHVVCPMVDPRSRRFLPLAAPLQTLPMRPMRAVMPSVAMSWGSSADRAWVRGLADFVRWVWPAVRERQPHAALLVGCDRPTARLKAALAGTGVALGSWRSALQVARSGGVAVFPSRGRAAVSPALLEAAAIGLPILASAATAATLAPTDAGEPMPIRRLPHNPEAWIEAVWRCWSDPSMASALSRTVRRHVERHHDSTQMTGALLAQINRLLPDGQAVAAKAARQYTAGRLAAPHRLAA